MDRKGHWLDRAAGGLRGLETVVLGILVVAMVGLAALQIILRNFFQTGFLWADPLLGMGLLWLTMLGALAATGARRHIAIDLIGHFAPPSWRKIIVRFTSLCAAVVCGVLAVAAWWYCQFQKDMDEPPLLHAPPWTYYLVMPVAFALMALRFLAQTLRPAGEEREAP